MSRRIGIESGLIGKERMVYPENQDLPPQEAVKAKGSAEGGIQESTPVEAKLTASRNRAAKIPKPETMQ